MKFAEKQAERQKLIERQAHILKSMRNKEDEILNKQVGEAEEKALKLFEEQERRREALKDQVEVSRRQQMEKRKKTSLGKHQKPLKKKPRGPPNTTRRGSGWPLGSLLLG